MAAQKWKKQNKKTPRFLVKFFNIFECLLTQSRVSRKVCTFQQTILLYQMQKITPRLLNRVGIADLPLLRTLLAIRQFLESGRLFCFISTCKFASFKNPFATITNLSELYFGFGRFILLLQTKNVISMNYGTSTSSWKPWR